MALMEPGQTTPPGGFYHIGGNMPPDVPSYVERRADRELYEALLQGEFCYVLTSRQMGKSSLMVRTVHRLRQEAVHAVVLDLTALGQNLTAEQWYEGLLDDLGQQLDLEDELEDFWLEHERLAPLRRWMRALQEVVLPQICPLSFVPGPWSAAASGSEDLSQRATNKGQRTKDEGRLIIFIDEIDTVQSLPFSTDEFFAAIRECYNRRAGAPEYNRLTFCLLGVATPSDLIRDTRLTPFNIGRRIELNDFTEAEAAPLRIGLELGGPDTLGRPAGEARALLQRILYWTGGHPYLTQRLCQAVAESDGRRQTADGSQSTPHRFPPKVPPADCLPPTVLVDRLCEELFLSHRAQEKDSNLLFVRERLLRSEVDLASLLDLYGKIRAGKRVTADGTNPLVDVLRLSGIVRMEESRAITPSPLHPLPPSSRLRVRNRIYERVFGREWIAANVPDAEVRRQRAAYRRGLVRAASLASVVVAVMAGLALWAVSSARQARAARRETQQHLQVTRVQRDELIQLTAQLKKTLTEKTAEQQRADEEKRKAQEAQRDERKQRQRAVAARKKADEERGRALEQRRIADQQREESRERLVRMHVAHGMRLVDEGNLMGALPWFTEALALEGGNAAREEVHRIRLASVLRQCPCPVQVCDLGPGIWRSEFSPDGRRVLTLRGTISRYSGAVEVWDMATGRPVASPLEHSGPVTYTAFSPDGRRVLTVGANTAQVWDAETGRSVTPPLGQSAQVRWAAFSPDGRQVATANRDRTVRVWDAETGQPALPPFQHTHDLRYVAFSPDGRYVLTAHSGAASGGVRVWDLATGRPVTPPQGIGEPGTDAEFSPDGRRLVAIPNTWTGGPRVWDIAAGTPVTPPLKHDSAVRKAVFSPDGRTILTESLDNAARVWDAATGEAVTPLLRNSAATWRSAYDPPGRRAAFSPDGRRVVTASADHSARVWDAVSGEPVTPPLLHDSEVRDASFTPDGRHVATRSEDGIARLWDLGTGHPALPTVRPGGDVASACFSPDGRSILTANRITMSARVWDTATGHPTTPPLKHNGSVRRAAFSPDGRRIVTASLDRTARVWNARTGTPVTPPLKHSGRVLDASFSPDGRRIVSVSVFYNPDHDAPSGPGESRVWDAGTGRPVTPPLRHPAEVKHAAFSPDGRYLVTASTDGTARVWDATSGKALRSLRHGGQVDRASFSPDGRRIVTACRDGAARIWDARTGRLAGRPLRHRSAVTDASFSLDGRRIVTASGDHTARVWDAATGKPTTSAMRHPEMVFSARFSADGRFVVTNSGWFAGARVWDAATGDALTPRFRDVWGASFSPDGRHLLLPYAQTLRVWDLSPDSRPTADLRLLAQGLAREQSDGSAGLVPVEQAALQEAWQRLRGKYPGDFAASAEQRRAWHEREAHDAERASQWPVAIAHLDRLIEARPARWSLHFRRADAYAALGQWSPAAAECAKAIKLGADDARVWYRLALAQLALQDRAGYRRTCARMLDHFGKDVTALEAGFIVVTCALAPDAGIDARRLVPLIEKAAAHWPEYGTFLNLLGAALYRAGRFEEALQRLEDAAKLPTRYFEGLSLGFNTYNALFRAMCHFRLGHAAEARQALAEAVRAIEQAPLPSPAYPLRLAYPAGSPLPRDVRPELQLLRAEAEALIH